MFKIKKIFRKDVVEKREQLLESLCKKFTSPWKISSREISKSTNIFYAPYKLEENLKVIFKNL